MIKAQRLAVIRAINRAKKSEYGATAIKVELEGQLNRDGYYYSIQECHNFMMERLGALGLAERRENEWLDVDDEDDEGETEWHPVHPLTFAKFYNDGSVDSEFTFTLMLDKPENIFVLPEIVKTFKALGAANGHGIEVGGAGMHMAFLKSKTGRYPISLQSPWERRFNNFRKSMNLLLPALYFLAANGEHSRGLGYRSPTIGYDTHRAAIDFRGGALEFRIFDTCYQKPEAILDNVVVMANCLKYWTNTYKPSGVEKITKSIGFGRDNDNTLQRFYVHHTHIDLLNFGLDRLKPSYHTIKELKTNRKFTVSKTQLRQLRKQQEKEAEASYKEYEDRLKFTRAISSRDIAEAHHQVFNELRRRGGLPRPSYREVMAETRKRLELDIVNRKSLKEYVADQLKAIEADCGRYTLAAE